MAKFGLAFVTTLESAFSLRFHFIANICSSDNGTTDFRNIPPFERSVYFYVTISGNFEQFQ